MSDVNEFKKKVKIWIKNNPHGEESELQDFCEELIPTKSFSSHFWLIEETILWWRSTYKNQVVNLSSDREDSL